MNEDILALITFPTTKWIEEVKASYKLDEKMIELILKLKNKEELPKGFFLQQGFVLKKETIVVTPQWKSQTTWLIL